MNATFAPAIFPHVADWVVILVTRKGVIIYEKISNSYILLKNPSPSLGQFLINLEYWNPNPEHYYCV